MAGKPGKSPLTNSRDGAQQPIDQPRGKVEALRDSEERFRAVFENAAVGIARVAPDGCFLEVNQRLCDIVGYAREELMTKAFADITHSDDLEQDLRAMRRMLAGEIDTYLREKRYYRKDGSVVWVNLTVSLMRKADGSPGYFISVIEDINARKQVEEKLRESEEKYRTLFESIDQGFCTIEVLFDKDERPVDYRFVVVNPAFERQTGIANAVGRRMREIAPLHEEHWFELYGRVALTGEPMRFEKPAEQLHRYYDVHAWRVGESGERKVAILFNDITKRKRAEEANLQRVALLADVSAALAEHQLSLQSMMQKSAEALVGRQDAAFARIWTLNPKESLLELQASAGMYTHLDGRHSRVPVGEFKIGLIAKERQPHLTNDVCNDPRISDPEWARETGMVAFAGYPLLVEDRVVGVMAMFARHPLTEDTVEAIATVAAPIAQGIERKRAEEALRASEEKFRILADTAPVMIWVSGTDKLCTFFNKPWLDFTGRSMDEELGAGWTKVIHPEDCDRCLETYVTAFEAREPFKMEYRLRGHDGEYRWILDHGIPRFSPGGDFLGYVGTCVDITERKQAEAEREQLAREQVARAAAEAANRSKDEFLAMVSHELRSPLNAILGYTRMLRYGPMDREAINNVTAIVERSAKAQLQIIEDLFD
ncbi:MAG TPA: PAS domain S-box protein, partial [Blastocatellia bacterium]|nr:PAS domain S-box protein [Blastocatellia bacterium]